MEIEHLYFFLRAGGLSWLLGGRPGMNRGKRVQAAVIATVGVTGTRCTQNTGRWF